MQIKGIHHLSIVVKDITRSLKFYSDAGKLLLNRVTHSEEKDCYFLQVPGDGELELVDYKGNQISDPLSARCVRFHHIAIKVDDPEQYYEAFMPVAHKWQFHLNHNDSFGHYACGPLDPDNILVEWIKSYEPIPNQYFVEKEFSIGTGFHHICFYVGNIEASYNFYNKELGFKLVREMFGTEIDCAPADAYYLQIPGSGELELIDHRGVQFKTGIADNHTGARSCSFLVDSAEDFYNYFSKKGYEVQINSNICKMYDPNGILLQFITDEGSQV